MAEIDCVRHRSVAPIGYSLVQPRKCRFNGGRGPTAASCGLQERLRGASRGRPCKRRVHAALPGVPRSCSHNWTARY